MDSPASGPLAGGRLSYLFLDVRDLEACLAFYRDTLGLAVVFESAGECAFLRLGGGPRLALYAGRLGAGRSPVLVAWDVPDVEAARAELDSRGVAVSDVQPVPGGRAVLFADPEGNRLEIHQPD